MSRVPAAPTISCRPPDLVLSVGAELGRPAEAGARHVPGPWARGIGRQRRKAAQFSNRHADIILCVVL